MSQMLGRAFSAIMVLCAVMFTAVISVQALFNPSVCPTGFANFGDSLTDTGNGIDALDSFLLNPPYGETFFGATAKRFSNGRLVPDFFSQAFRFPLLDAYFSVASFNYKNGINFAFSGATAFNLVPPPATSFSVTPFQTSQFIRFQNSVIGTQAQFVGDYSISLAVTNSVSDERFWDFCGSRHRGCVNFNLELPITTNPSQNPFSTWLYTITAGFNDLLAPIGNGTSLAYVNGTIVPQAVNAIATAIVTLYERGARQFLIFGIPPGGCATFILTVQANNYAKDNMGCFPEVNSVVKNFNAQLLSEIKVLRKNLTRASIAYFDYYSATMDILTSPAVFGFSPSLTLTACCGAPGNGTLNFNPAVGCGFLLGSNSCANPDEYVMWDGAHFTEAAYRVIAIFALNGLFTDGGVNYAASCNLDLSNFRSGITFRQAYPLQTCNNLFT